MKKTLITLLALAACAQAVEPEFLYPLTTPDDWTLGSRLQRPVVTIDGTTQTLSNTVCNWGQNTAVYTVATPISISDTPLRFDFNLTTNGTLDAAVALTLIDSTQNKAVTVGMGQYSAGNGAIAYGISEVKETPFYNFQLVNPSGTLGSIAAQETKHISGLFSMNEENKVVLTLPASGSENPAALEIGDTFTLDKVVVSYDCGNGNSAPVFSNLKLTTPEPATATLSLLALAGLAARRRRH